MNTERVNTEGHNGNEAGTGQDPIYIAGPDRSGTTLMYGLLASHPNLSMTRRSNMWRYFYDRYGDLSIDKNMDRCIEDMVRYRKMGHLHPDPKRIRAEFESGPRTYGRLFSIFHMQHARRSGKQRWGDKSLHNEHFADAIFSEFPTARVIHMVRDPRDRYASVSHRHGQRISRVGGVSARWNRSVDAGLRNQRRFPDQYMFVRYEDLATSPEDTLLEVCSFIGEEFDERMLDLRGNPDVKASQSNSSFGDLGRRAISTRAIGRFREVLEPEEIAFIQAVSKKGMHRFEYPREGIPVSRLGARYYVIGFPHALARMWAWRANARLRLARGPRLPEAKMLDRPVNTSGAESR